MQRCLPCRDRERADTTFEFADAFLEHRGRRIGDTAVAKAFRFEIEQGRAVIGAVERMGDGLVDRDGNCWWSDRARSRREWQSFRCASVHLYVFA